ASEIFTWLEFRPVLFRSQAALDALRAQAGAAPLDATRIGAFGFCFGGSAVLELARSGADVAGVVSLHGGLAPGAQSETAARIAEIGRASWRANGAGPVVA